MTLRDIRRSDAFNRVRGFDASARFHVWHSRLGVSDAVDRRAQEALRADRSFAIAGPSGSGKTSILAAATLATDGLERARLPIPLSVTGTADRAADPRELGADVVRNIARLKDDAQRLVDRSSVAGRADGEQRRTTIRSGFRGTNLSREIQERTESFDFERTPAEVFDVVREAVRLLRDSHLLPVLVLEDADGLLRLPGRSEEERRTLANAFFADGLYALVGEIEVPALIAIQEDYLGLSGFQRLEQLLDGPPARPPAPADCDDQAMSLIVSHSLQQASSGLAEAHEVFESEALELLAQTRFAIGTMRTVIEVCNTALITAAQHSHELVTRDDLAYAITQETSV